MQETRGRGISRTFVKSEYRPLIETSRSVAQSQLSIEQTRMLQVIHTSDSSSTAHFHSMIYLFSRADISLICMHDLL